MAIAERTRTLNVPIEVIWELIADPHHMPRWWPGVIRMEAVGDEHFTQVFKTKKQRSVRLDFHVLESDAPRRRSWEQEIAGTPFERVLSQLVIDVQLEPSGAGTAVTITQHQKLRGYSRTGGFLLRRATKTRLDEALDGLERICV